MVGGQIGNDRTVGAALHVHQLEGAELHHGKVRLLHLRAQGQQRGTDVAPQPDGMPLRLQHFADEGRGGGLTVRTGDGNQGTGADLEEYLHLAGDFGTLMAEIFQCRIGRVHTGGTEHQGCIKVR